ncbi:MAG TPA: YafY family protein [Polyangiaceae bacterium]|nr:YafY family protein [Polyangiaceae bacterium]
MSRADRLFQIVDQLRRHRFLTAAQLADHFEVSQRTIYRDVLDLNTSGIPVVGEAGVGYRLDPNYRLPPLMFSHEEVEALVIGMRMVESWGDADLRRSARSILDKVNAVLPETGAERLNKTALFSLSFGAGERASRHLGALRQAINRQYKLVFAYRDERGNASKRTVRPLGLYFWGQSWTLAAYCELRTDFRNFRTDRMERLSITEDRFELVPPCTLEDYLAAMNEPRNRL